MITFDELLNAAKQKNASDLHLTAGLPPKIRVDGELVSLNYPSLAPSDVENVVYKLMDEKQKEVFEKYGELDFAFSIPNVGRFRINVYRQRGSMACAMRIVGTTIPELSMLGVPESVHNFCNKKRGLVLVTGPTGSGKSTTLASIIDKINKEKAVHIITLEDPIEYLHNHDKAMVNQREIGLDTTSYSRALTAALREDPDVIFVGELKDTETIQTAITAAETGHLVLSTVHTLGAVATVERLIDVFPSHAQQQIKIQLAMVLEGIVSQQLLPAANRSGRVAAFEVLTGNKQIRKLIREGNLDDIEEVMEKSQVMTTMDESIVKLYKDEKISKENALSYATEMSYVESKI